MNTKTVFSNRFRLKENYSTRTLLIYWCRNYLLVFRTIRTVNTGVPETVPSSYLSGVAPFREA